MSDPRKGDTIISARGKMYWCEESADGERIAAVCADTGRRTTFRLSRLECLDYDEGLWAEIPPRDA